MDVSNTALVLAVHLLNVNHFFCPGWMTQCQFQYSMWMRITSSALILCVQWVRESWMNHSMNENHVLIVVWVAAVPLPAGMLAAELNWTEKGTNQSMKWSRSFCSLKRFARSNSTFTTDTTLDAPCVSSSMRWCLRWMYICFAMARRDFFVQPYQFDPESVPEGEAPEEVQTLWLQEDVSEWLVCLNDVSLFVCVVTFTTM